MNIRARIAAIGLLLILSASSSVAGEINPEALIKVVAFGWKAIKAIIEIESFIKDNKFEKDVIDALDEIRESTARIESLITDEADRIIKELSVKIDMKKVDDFVDTVGKINYVFEEEFLKYFTGNDIYQNETIENYINAMINPLKFRKKLLLIRQYTVPTHSIPNREDKRVFEILHDYITIKEDHVSDCNQGASGYDLLFAVFNLAITALSKGYAMVAHAYRYRQLHSSTTDPNAWNTELHDALDKYKDTVLLIAEVARASAEGESKAIRRCDPKSNKFIEGVNYQSYQFLTTFVANDYMLDNRNYIIDGLSSDERTASFCDGIIYNITYEAHSLGACVAPLNSKRRYNYISVLGGDAYYYNKGRVTEGCDKDYGLYHSKTHLHFYFSRYICEEPASGKKAAYFNITAQYSDLSNKRVITGIRLVTKLSITYFEIQEGVLVNGTIDNNTINWNDEVTKRLDDYEKNNRLPSYTDGDLIRLTYDLRSLDLDDIVLPAGVVAVGVQFRVVENHLTFRVAGIRIFNELEQPVTSSEVEWFNQTNPNRTELLINDLDIPTFGKKANLELSKPGENYIKFQMSSWNIDGGQTLYPFIDLQEVTTYPPAPIGGVGLFYKGQPGFGGFIAPKLISANNTIFMSEEYLNNIFNISTSNLSIEDMENLSNDKYVPYEIILSFLCIILLFYFAYKNNFLNIKRFPYTYL